MRTKVSSCPNHVEACGPKIENRVSKTRLLFLKTKSLRLDIQLESTWDVGMNINRAFKGEIEIESLRLDFQVDITWKRANSDLIRT